MANNDKPSKKHSPPESPAARADATRGSAELRNRLSALAAEAGSADAGELTPHSFEESIQRLGHLVELLEAGELPLEESLLRFEEGIRIARRAQALLENAERRVEELLHVDEAGNPVTRDLETE